jgi:hypothetical protein
VGVPILKDIVTEEQYNAATGTKSPSLLTPTEANKKEHTGAMSELPRSTTCVQGPGVAGYQVLEPPPWGDRERERERERARPAPACSSVSGERAATAAGTGGSCPRCAASQGAVRRGSAAATALLGRSARVSHSTAAGAKRWEEAALGGSNAGSHRQGPLAWHSGRWQPPLGHARGAAPVVVSWPG